MVVFKRHGVLQHNILLDLILDDGGKYIRDKRIILKSNREVTEKQALGSPYNQLYLI